METKGDTNGGTKGKPILETKGETNGETKEGYQWGNQRRVPMGRSKVETNGETKGRPMGETKVGDQVDQWGD